MGRLQVFFRLALSIEVVLALLAARNAVFRALLAASNDAVLELLAVALFRKFRTVSPIFVAALNKG